MTTYRLSDPTLKRRWEALFFLAIVMGVVVAVGVVVAGVALRVNPFAFAVALPLGAVVTAVLIGLLDSAGDREYKAALRAAESEAK